MALADPSDPERMFLDMGEVSLARPLMFGDVLADVPCSRGGDPFSQVMLMTHPCSMRRGPNLRDTIVTASVEDCPYPGFSADKWRSGAYDYLPLFDFPAPDQKKAVFFGGLHAASSAALNPASRILTLSDYGVAVLLQRWIYQLSRDPVPLDVLSELVAPVLAEADIQEEWCEAALACSSPDSNPMEVIRDATAEVQVVLGPPSGDSLRERLKLPAERTSVRKAVALKRNERFGT